MADELRADKLIQVLERIAVALERRPEWNAAVPVRVQCAHEPGETRARTYCKKCGAPMAPIERAGVEAGR